MTCPTASTPGKDLCSPHPFKPQVCGESLMITFRTWKSPTGCTVAAGGRPEIRHLPPVQILCWTQRCILKFAWCGSPETGLQAGWMFAMAAHLKQAPRRVPKVRLKAVIKPGLAQATEPVATNASTPVYAVMSTTVLCLTSQILPGMLTEMRLRSAAMVRESGCLSMSCI